MPKIDFWYRLGKAAALLTMSWPFGGVEVCGKERVPRTGPLLIAVNHQSDADPAAILYAMNRQVYFMAKRELFAGKVFSYLLRAVHVFPVDRGGNDGAALLKARQLLSEERALVLFPEGTRSPGALAQASDGVAYIAMRTGAPIVPMAITGTETLSTIWSAAFNSRRLCVSFGEPIELSPQFGRINREEIRQGTDRLMQAIASLSPQPYRGFYG